LKFWYLTVIPFLRFPGHRGSSKIPSIIYYDFGGKVQTIGYKVVIQDETAPEDGGQINLAQWSAAIPPFLNQNLLICHRLLHKLHLRPQNNATTIQLKTFIFSMHPFVNGIDLWLSFEKEIYFVLSRMDGSRSNGGCTKLPFWLA